MHSDGEWSEEDFEKGEYTPLLEPTSAKTVGTDFPEVVLDVDDLCGNPMEIEDEGETLILCSICAQPWPSNEFELTMHNNSEKHRAAARAIAIFNAEMNPLYQFKYGVKEKEQKKRDMGKCSICNDEYPWSEFTPNQRHLADEGQKIWCRGCIDLVENVRAKVVTRFFQTSNTASNCNAFVQACQEEFSCSSPEFNLIAKNVFNLSRGHRNMNTIGNIFTPIMLDNIKGDPVDTLRLIMTDFHDLKIREKCLVRPKNFIYKEIVRQCGACGDMKTERGFHSSQWEGPAVVERIKRQCFQCQKVPQPRRCCGCSNIFSNAEDFSPETMVLPLSTPTRCNHCITDDIPIHSYLHDLIATKVQCSTCFRVLGEDKFHPTTWKFLHLASKANCLQCESNFRFPLVDGVETIHCSACNEQKSKKQFDLDEIQNVKRNIPARCVHCVKLNTRYKYFNQGIGRIPCSHCHQMKSFGDFSPKNIFSWTPICVPCIDQNPSIICVRCGQADTLYEPRLLLHHSKLCQRCVQQALCLACNTIKYEFEYGDQERRDPFGFCSVCAFRREPPLVKEIECEGCHRCLPIRKENFSVDQVWKFRLAIKPFFCVQCEH